MIVLVGILGFLVGLLVSHHYIVVPAWETEAELRKELGKVRGELWEKTQDLTTLQYLVGRLGCPTPGWYLPQKPKVTPAIKTRAHSDVLPFDSIDDLIRPHPEDLLK